MSKINIRRWLWFPVVREHAWLLGVSLLVIPLLGLFAIPKFPAFKEFEAVQGPASQFALWSLALILLNFVVFFTHARGDYLLVKSSLRPIAGSFVVLSIAMTAAWAGYRIFARDAPPPDLGALMGGSPFEWTRLVRSVFVAQSGLMMVLLFSGIWKPSAPETLELAQSWRDLKPWIDRLYRGPVSEKWTSDDANRLHARLVQIAERAGKLAPRNLPDEDILLALTLAKHAAAIDGKLANPLSDYPSLRNHADLKESFLFLLGENSNESA
jgi:hypothetical protein